MRRPRDEDPLLLPDPRTGAVSFAACPRCGSRRRDPEAIACWHCLDCGFAQCAARWRPREEPSRR